MTEQLAIDFNPQHAARRRDPATSKTAAHAAASFAASHAGRILLALQQHGPATAKELAPLVGLTHVQIDRRRHELVKAGFVRVLDTVRDGCNVMEAIRR